MLSLHSNHSAQREITPRNDQFDQQTTMNEDRRSCDTNVATSGSSSTVDLPKGDQPTFVKVAAASDYDSVSSSVVNLRSGISNIEAGENFSKRPIAQSWLFRKSWLSSVHHTSSGSDSDSDESGSDDDYDSGDDLYSDSDSDSDSSSDSEEDIEKSLDCKRYRESNEKSGCGCESGFWLWVHPLKGIVFGMPPLTEM